ncbi:VOC family protein, partial [Flavobacterium chungangense]
ILGFQKLGGFQKHNNYDGIFIGKPDLDWHFEFTQSQTKANHIFDEDDIIVLYPDTIAKYNSLLENLLKNNIQKITAMNPYWNENGQMYLDPDGYRIVVSPLKAQN